MSPEKALLSQYSGNQFEFSYLLTETDIEIDIVCERPGKTTLFIEIKSTSEIQEQHTKAFVLLNNDLPSESEKLIFSNDRLEREIIGVKCLYWLNGLKQYFTGPDIIDFEKFSH